MPISDYEHWNEEAPRIWYEENKDAMRDGDPRADMTDEEIKESVSRKFGDPDFDPDHDEW